MVTVLHATIFFRSVPEVRNVLHIYSQQVCVTTYIEPLPFLVCFLDDSYRTRTFGWSLYDAPSFCGCQYSLYKIKLFNLKPVDPLGPSEV
jgi:hypothetical protein